MNVRVEQGVFHFVLGEMAPGQSGKAEFIPAFRGVVPEGEAAKLFEFLKQKAEASTPHGETGVANQETSAESDSVKVDRDAELSDSIDPSSADVVRKRKIATSDGEPHTK
jgi:hypothetical protein